jgi:hypothetical protein
MRLCILQTLVCYVLVFGSPIEASAARADDPSGRIPALHGNVLSVRFYDGDGRAPSTYQHYDDFFVALKTNYVYWELNIVHQPLSPGGQLTVEDIWYGPDGYEIHRASRTLPSRAGNDLTRFYGSARLVDPVAVDIPDPTYYDCVAARRNPNLPYRDCSQTTTSYIKRWREGTYRVVLRVDGKNVAEGVFVMTLLERMNADVRARTADRSAPLNRIDEIGAKVTSLRFLSWASPQVEHGVPGTRFSAPWGVSWEIGLQLPPVGQWGLLPIEQLLYLNNGAGAQLVQRRVLPAGIPADARIVTHAERFSWDEDDRYYWYRANSSMQWPGRWLRGTYRLDLFVAGRKIASGTFDVQ